MIYEIRYENTEIQEACEQRRVAVKIFGDAGAKRLGRRVKELQTSPDAATLRQGPGGWHPIKFDWPGCQAGSITGSKRIVVQPIETDNGQPGWLVRCLGDCYDH